jgi:hypothetical protein
MPTTYIYIYYKKKKCFYKWILKLLIVIKVVKRDGLIGPINPKKKKKKNIINKGGNFYVYFKFFEKTSDKNFSHKHFYIFF